MYNVQIHENSQSTYRERRMRSRFECYIQAENSNHFEHDIKWFNKSWVFNIRQLNYLQLNGKHLFYLLNVMIDT